MGGTILQEILDLFLKAIPGVIATGIITALGLLFRAQANRSRVKRSSYSGDWFGSIFNDDDTLKKSDKFVISVDNNSATGHVYRITPHSEHERNWLFNGRIQSKSFFAAYWSEDERNTSSGIWLLRQTNDTTFSGHYYRIEEADRHTPTRIGAFRMILRKDKEIDPTEYHDLLEQIPEVKVHMGEPIQHAGIEILEHHRRVTRSPTRLEVIEKHEE